MVSLLILLSVLIFTEGSISAFDSRSTSQWSCCEAGSYYKTIFASNGGRDSLANNWPTLIPRFPTSSRRRVSPLLERPSLCVHNVILRFWMDETWVMPYSCCWLTFSSLLYVLAICTLKLFASLLLSLCSFSCFQPLIASKFVCLTHNFDMCYICDQI